MASTILNNEVIKEKKTSDMKAYMREYRKKNIDKIKEQKICELCNVSYMTSNITNHRRSMQHQYHLLKIENAKLKEQIKLLEK